MLCSRSVASVAPKGTMTTSSTTSPSKAGFSTGQKVLATAGVLGAAVSIAALGTFGTFGGSTSASQKVDSGSAGIDMPHSNLNAPVSGMLPGDTVERIATISNAGSSRLRDILLSTTIVTGSALTSDETNGLQVAIDGCSIPWTAVSGGPDVCSGHQWPVVAERAVAALTPGMPLDMYSVSVGQSDYLRATFKLPVTADASFQNLSAELDFQFDGVQRPGQFID